MLQESGVHTNGFVYDGGTYSGTSGVGNPSTFRSVSGNTFGVDNQITNTGWGYDGNGNPTTYNGSALTFDAENRLTKIGSTMTCGYRADGLRVWKGDGSGSNGFRLAEMGIIFGEIGKNGPLFRDATLPEGWKIKPTMACFRDRNAATSSAATSAALSVPVRYLPSQGGAPLAKALLG